ncbi:MAG TPA: NUDIX domain-containing protein [Candidatus Saccharimonadales bacterium]|jgi:8-oxo-dGTP diphosphatase|nr:NUDIX domain-containing protein [Candidatus Saccharimonadales bacterium]
MNPKIVKSRDIYGVECEVPISDLRWRPAAYAIAIRGDTILLVSEDNGYHLPGGGVDLGEMPEDGVIREVKEETGLEISNLRLVGLLSTFFTPSHQKKSEHYQSLLLYYLCDVADGEVSLDDQMDDEKEYGLMPEWVSIAHLDTLRVGSTVDWRPIVKEALQD